MNPKILHKELKFRTSRSSGSGGQHVNKVETRVELLFDVPHSCLLNDAFRERILTELKNRINKDGILIIASEASRSQAKNRELAVEKFDKLISEALRPRKKRKGPKPLKADKKKRLEAKRRQAEKKALRGKVVISG